MTKVCYLKGESSGRVRFIPAAAYASSSAFTNRSISATAIDDMITKGLDRVNLGCISLADLKKEIGPLVIGGDMLVRSTEDSRDQDFRYFELMMT